MRIRVLMLITDLDIGGSPSDLYRLATALNGSEFDVRVACLSPPGQVSEMLDRAGIPTFACNAAGPWDIRALWRLARLIQSQRPHLVHAALFHASIAACVIAPLAGVPSRRIITEIKTVEVERLWHLTVGGLACRMCRCVVGNSRAVVDHLRRRAHIPRSLLRTIPGGVDVARFTDVDPVERSSLGVPNDAPLLLWVGRLDPVKGLDDLVDALVLLDDPRIHLVLCGDGPHESALQSRIARQGLTERVRFLGRRMDIPNLLASSDVFVFPSLTEGLPNALLEAMAAGLPIVTTDVPGCRDLIADGRTGLLVSPCRPRELAEAVQRLTADRALGRRLGHAARNHVARHYDMEAYVQRYAALYHEVYGTPPM